MIIARYILYSVSHVMPHTVTHSRMSLFNLNKVSVDVPGYIYYYYDWLLNGAITAHTKMPVSRIKE